VELMKRTGPNSQGSIFACRNCAGAVGKSGDVVDEGRVAGEGLHGFRLVKSISVDHTVLSAG